MNPVNNYYSLQSRAKQNLYPLILNSILKILVVISVYLLSGLLFQYGYASQHDNADTIVDPYQAQHGSVWFLPDNGSGDSVYIEAIQLQADVDYEVNASIARAKVKQRFINSSSLWAEAIYVFPLPDRAAVDHFRMIIGERIIEGQLKERVAAKKTYETARSAGKKASLIEQQRPNVFTTSVSNIAPGEEITVEFEFQQVIDYKDNAYRLRFPMVVGPRYHTEQDSIKNLTDPVVDESSVYTETDRVKNSNNATRIHVLLDAGVSLNELYSSYHHININQTSETRYSVSTIGEHIVANRDFELVWKPQLNNNPQLSVFNEKLDGDKGNVSNYSILTLLPPELSHLQQKVQERDIVFVIDISGSMAGTSIEQAKRSLITALDGLSSIDRFNIIWFNDDTGSLFQQSVSALPQYKNHARHFIENLEAGGGTEMLPAMKLALSKQQAFSRFRQVVFITDGNISNETELFSVIEQQPGNSRLFTIGIGSAPNAYFMRKAAQKGRGTFTYIGDVNEVHEKTTTLFNKLKTPALINIQLTINADTTDNNVYEIFPKFIPDLYAGETATVLIKGKNIPQSISIKGDYGNTEWHSNAKLKTTSQSGIHLSWAREKISSLMNQRHEATNETERESIQQELTDTALQHHLVSPYTSLVAVDVTPVNANGLLYRERLKNNLPHGWENTISANGLMLAQTAAGSTHNLFLALALFFTGLFIYRLKGRPS